jgi:hypothetical protein
MLVLVKEGTRSWALPLKTLHVALGHPPKGWTPKKERAEVEAGDDDGTTFRFLEHAHHYLFKKGSLDHYLKHFYHPMHDITHCFPLNSADQKKMDLSVVYSYACCLLTAFKHTEAVKDHLAMEVASTKSLKTNKEHDLTVSPSPTRYPRL